MRISDWSSDVCSSDLIRDHVLDRLLLARLHLRDDEILQITDLHGVVDHLLAVLHATDLCGDRARPALDLVGIELAGAHLLADQRDRQRYREILDAIDDLTLRRLVGPILDEADD